MPSAKVLEEKKAKVAALKERIGAAVAGIVVDYKGITVEDDTKLRKELREAGVHYTVAKNMVAGIEYWDMKNREHSKDKAKALWTELKVSF